MKKEIFIIALLVSNITCAWFWYLNKKEADLQKEIAARFEQIARDNELKAQLNAEEAMKQRQIAELNAALALEKTQAFEKLRAGK